MKSGFWIFRTVTSSAKKVVNGYGLQDCATYGPYADQQACLDGLNQWYRCMQYLFNDVVIHPYVRLTEYMINEAVRSSYSVEISSLNIPSPVPNEEWHMAELKRSSEGGVK